MMYGNKLAVAIKNNGKVIRENGDTVYIPFNSEYSIFIKNLNNKRVKVNVEIDGEDIGTTGDLVINANSSVDLLRYLDTDHAFKFIEKTKEISEHRGDRAEDGLIRIEYWFEKDNPKLTWTDSWAYYGDSSTGNGYERYPISWQNAVSTTTKDTITKTYCSNNSATISNLSYNETPDSNYVVNDSNNGGITVKGNRTGQEFIHTIFNAEDTSCVMVIQMKGESKENRIEKPIYTKTKIICPTCGKKNKSNARYCNRCGTALFD